VPILGKILTAQELRCPRGGIEREALQPLEYNKHIPEAHTHISRRAKNKSPTSARNCDSSL
jgi:uncharacterized C2H2 Zn-finger protein